MGEGIDRLAERRGLDRAVYAPAEDSALLAAVVSEEVTGSEVVIDVGTGSGYVARRLVDAVDPFVLGVDLNPHACRRAADAGVPTVRGDLLAAVAPSVADVVVCNPPYLPTTPAAERDDWLGTAVAGGTTGRAVVDRLLADVGRVLVDDGRVYLLVSSVMDVTAVRRSAREHGFAATEIARDDSYPDEVLAVLRFDSTR